MFALTHIYSILIYFSILSIAISSHILRENVDHTKRVDYSRISRASGHALHRVIIAVKQNNPDKIKSLLYKVSDINDPDYGKHLSFEEVGQLVANTESTNSVIDWLTSENIKIVEKTIYGEYITAEASVSTWERVLNTEMHEFVCVNRSTTCSHPERSVIRGKSYSVPIHLNDHIFAIHRITQLPPRIMSRMKMRRLSKDEEQLLDNELDSTDDGIIRGFVTPNVLKEIYGISGTSNGLGSQAIYGGLGQTFLPSDLKSFQAYYRLPDNPVVKYVNNIPSNTVCNDQNSNSCTEASLDIQYITSVSGTVPTTYWYDYSESGDFVQFSTTIANTPDPSFVYSISYGAYEVDIHSNLVQTFNFEAMKASLRGVTILVASGDDGVAGGDFRPVSDGGGGEPISRCGYYASWPASSPYVTAVGATMNGILPNSHEIVCSSKTQSLITSGGGFSNQNSAPSFQKSAINSYLSKFSPVQSKFKPYSSSNRGYPDVSMPGNDFIVMIGGHRVLISGTSASSPVFAGMVSIVNSVRLKYNISTTGLGWLNPSIYANNGGYARDITYGDNSCTASSSACCIIGFEAKSGWDPVTGFGSIDFPKFLSYYTVDIPTAMPTTQPTYIPSPTSIYVNLYQTFESSKVNFNTLLLDSDSLLSLISIVKEYVKPTRPVDVTISSVLGRNVTANNKKDYLIFVNFTITYVKYTTPVEKDSVSADLVANVSSSISQAILSGKYLLKLKSSGLKILESLTPTGSNSNSVEYPDAAITNNDDDTVPKSKADILAVITTLVVLLAMLIIALVLLWRICYKPTNMLVNRFTPLAERGYSNMYGFGLSSHRSDYVPEVSAVPEIVNYPVVSAIPTQQNVEVLPSEFSRVRLHSRGTGSGTQTPNASLLERAMVSQSPSKFNHAYV